MNGNILLIVELSIIFVETVVLLFLIYHIKELRRSSILTHEQIKAMREAIYEIHEFVKELHHKESNR